MKFSKNSLMKVILISENPETPCFTSSVDERYFASKLDVMRLENDNDIARVLSENPEWDVIITQSAKEESWSQYPTLCGMPRWIRCRWFHFNDYENHGDYVYETMMSYQMTVTSDITPLFSVFTPLYKSRPEFFFAAYLSLKQQTVNNWEWVIVDDSPEPLTWVTEYFKQNPDPRVKYFRIVPTNGNIGLSKWRACCMTTGKWLVEFDHDDLFIPDAFHIMTKAISQFPDAGFVYSDNEDIDGEGRHLDKIYGDSFAYDFGHPYLCDGHYINECPNLNSATIRHIVGMPNHVRAWRRDIYFLIGGHNQMARIADDYELCVRTFLATPMIRIKYPIYKQRYYDGNSQDSDINRSDIQRRVAVIADHYNKMLHERMMQLVGEDTCYEEGLYASQVAQKCMEIEDKSIVPFANYLFEMPEHYK